MSRTYMYVVDRDFGFAPNPFHGTCTLATCKPRIRARAQLEDWVIGMGGSRLEATGRCVFAMKVTATMSFNEYWSSPGYFDKRPVRNGSRRMLVGDNIYYYDDQVKEWQQADSHHSNPDGTSNDDNTKNDTSADRVLLSTEFYYFGRDAPVVPKQVLTKLGYTNVRNYRVFEHQAAVELVQWLQQSFGSDRNLVLADPFDFAESEKRYSVKGNRVT